MLLLKDLTQKIPGLRTAVGVSTASREGQPELNLAASNLQRPADTGFVSSPSFSSLYAANSADAKDLGERADYLEKGLAPS